MSAYQPRQCSQPASQRYIEWLTLTLPTTITISTAAPPIIHHTPPTEQGILTHVSPKPASASEAQKQRTAAAVVVSVSVVVVLVLVVVVVAVRKHVYSLRSLPRLSASNHHLQHSRKKRRILRACVRVYRIC
ncbi:hypothetical protein BZA05DRAFT_181961 [Tricharina praecox]|uniref:uncharacterized protein n=1 Tax=Tricharina praecox TaxID=43433 RepID=UPI00221E69FF|nr:uncharacterized protein BZA05DRAFT_181961 [Tricharina praecox]KAI5843587.1 hypothetical protein BZA05DRAFT_181961 [Tricharina praecox]